MFDPLFYARLNAIQNYQNQRANQVNLEQLQANKEELRKLRQLLSEEAKKPQCPHCGGPSEKGFDRCKNCGQEIIWIGHFMGKPGQEQQLAIAMQQYQIAEQEKQQRRLQNQREADREANRCAWIEYDRRPWTDVGSFIRFILKVAIPIIGFWLAWFLISRNSMAIYKSGNSSIIYFLRGLVGFILHGVCLAIAFFQCVKSKPKSPRDLESVDNPVPKKPERVLHQCPSCRETIDLNSFDTGSTVRCFTCHARITVP